MSPTGRFHNMVLGVFPGALISVAFPQQQNTPMGKVARQSFINSAGVSRSIRRPTVSGYFLISSLSHRRLPISQQTNMMMVIYLFGANVIRLPLTRIHRSSNVGLWTSFIMCLVYAQVTLCPNGIMEPAQRHRANMRTNSINADPFLTPSSPPRAIIDKQNKFQFLHQCSDPGTDDPYQPPPATTL